YRKYRPQTFISPFNFSTFFPSGITWKSEAVFKGVSFLSNSITATFSCEGLYPTCEKPMFGLRFQLAMALGSTYHDKTFPVLFAGNKLRTMNQPFCAKLRPSNNIKFSSAVSETIFTLRSGSSGASTNVFPEAIGEGTINSPRPLSSKVVWPANCGIFLLIGSMLVLLLGYNGKFPGFPSAKYDFSKYAEGRNSRLKPALPTSFSGTGLSKYTDISTPLSFAVTTTLELKSYSSYRNPTSMLLFFLSTFLLIVFGIRSHCSGVF